MTQTTPVRVQPPSQQTANLRYRVAMQPTAHLFDVTLHLSEWKDDLLELRFPVWTPGSYLVREYAKHLQDFSATTRSHQQLSWRKVSKNSWQIDTEGASEIEVRYRMFANELTVRTNHLDTTHGYFNGAALFFFVPGWENSPVEVTIVPPDPNWTVATALPSVPGKPLTYRSPDFDTLVDSPFEIGTHQLYSFEVEGKDHDLVVWGRGNFDAKAAIADTKKIIHTEAQLFGELPYDRYLFILHLSASGYGGLEHKDSCSLNYPRLGFGDRDKYHRFMQLVAHEFFHLWNVKRIRPKALEKFNYEREVYTTSLWFCEGVTSYYDILLPLRAGVYDGKAFLKGLSNDLNRYLTTPGRKVQPLGESSFDAWIKLYRRDANSDNAQISYYLKGAVVALMLDLEIRQVTKNQRSLDDVMRQMWQQFGKDEIGYSPSQLRQVIESVAGCDFGDFLHHYIHGTRELPLDEYLAPFGLKVESDRGKQPPFLGVRFNSDQGNTVQFVEFDSPAQKAGIDTGDEILAIDGLRVSASQWNDRLKDFSPGDTVDISFFHQDELRTVPVTLGKPHPSRYKLVPLEKPTPQQQDNLERWLGVSVETLQK